MDDQLQSVGDYSKSTTCGYSVIQDIIKKTKACLIFVAKTLKKQVHALHPGMMAQDVPDADCAA